MSSEREYKQMQRMSLFLKTWFHIFFYQNDTRLDSENLFEIRKGSINGLTRSSTTDNKLCQRDK